MLRGLLRQSKFIKQVAVAVIQGWYNVWGGTGLEGVTKPAAAPPGGPAVARLEASPEATGAVTDIARRVAAEAILLELGQMKGAYETGDALLGAASDYVSQQLDELNQIATTVLGGQDPFIVARDAAAEGLHSLEARIGELTQMKAMSTTAKEKATGLKEFSDEALAAIDVLVVPDVKIPEADLGEGVLADAAEAVADTAGGVANAGIEVLVAEINEEVEAAKATLRAPIQELKAGADDVAAFMQIVVDQAGEQIAFAQAKIASFTAALEQCNNFEDVVNLIVQQVFEMLGVESDFKVEDVREGWQEVGTMIDEAILVRAEGLRDSASGGGPAPAPPASAPVFAAPPAEPPDGGGDGAGGGSPNGGGGAAGGRSGRGGAPGGGVGAAAAAATTAAAGARSPSARRAPVRPGGAEAQAAGAAAAGAAAAAPAGAQAAAADAAAAAGAGAAAGADAAGAAAAGAGARAAGADAVPDERRRN